MPSLKVLTLCLATLSVSAFGQAPRSAAPGSLNPGTLNYVEGQASLEGHPLHNDGQGHAALAAGQYLATAHGKAEVLLAPGVFLRIGDDTTVQMVSPDLTHTEVRLEQGKADIEVDQLFPQNDILIDLKNGQTELLKPGLYAFDAGSTTVKVYAGEAQVFPGADLKSDVKPTKVKSGHQLALSASPLKPQGFNRDQAQDDLYKWSGLRSQYLGEANMTLAREYVGYPGFYPGWYWAGYPFGYTWLPGDGLFWSPFGYGFYSPFYLYGAGFYGRGFYGGYRGGYIGHAYVGGFHSGAGRR